MMVSRQVSSNFLSVSGGNVSFNNRLGPNLPGPKLQTFLDARISHSYCFSKY